MVKEKRVRLGIRLIESLNNELNEFADLRGFTSKNCYVSYIIKKHLKEEREKLEKYELWIIKRKEVIVWH